jgi:hypothetical protein
VLLIIIGIALLYTLIREVRKIPPKLFTLMATAFVDMVGLLMILPLLPFYVKTLGGSGIQFLGFHLGTGIINGFIVAFIHCCTTVSAPMWGSFPIVSVGDPLCLSLLVPLRLLTSYLDLRTRFCCSSCHGLFRALVGELLG